MSDAARPLASRPVPRTVRSARRWLRALHDELGVAGLAAAAALPGLAAAVDQHAAAVQDATTIGLEATAAVAGLLLLAGYAHGVLTEALAHGWHPPAAGPQGWSRADWTSVRLAAVCALSTRPDRVGSTDLPPWPRTITPPST
ncbi:DUF6401 family natural product biosynthesis protein [Pseudonocardia sp. NPDC049154]|uniref:DUF6401 family natural product biosynthesis protein n=1 Tax=Pseudonocardia sp. NPDC049154 TaxID=3155501 RepID=UPI0033CA7F39